MAKQTGRPPPKATGPGFRPGGDYLLAVALSWMVPGAGHWLLGLRGRAVLMGGLLLGTFWWGEAIAGGYAVTRKEHPVFFCGQIGIGLSAVAANKLQWGEATVYPPPQIQKGIDRKIPPRLATGILLTSVSGLLNVLLVLHVMDPRSWEGRASGGGGGPRGPETKRG